MVGAGGIDAVLVRHNFPELGTDLVAALARLDVNDLSHCTRLVGLGIVSEAVFYLRINLVYCCFEAHAAAENHCLQALYLR